MLARVTSFPARLVGVGVRKRLGAWWRGEPRPESAGASRPEPGDMRSPSDWLVVAERLWGPSNLGPGEDAYFPRLALGLNLSADKTLAYFGIGLGGAARRIVDKSDVWIVGFEADADAAAQGKEQCRRAGQGKKVAISHVTYDFLSLPKEKFHAAIAKEAFHDVANKARVFQQIARALKGGGAFLITDYVVTGDPLDAGGCMALFGKRSAPVSPLTTAEYLALLARHGLDLRVNENVTELYAGFVMDGWSNLRSLLDHLGAQADNPVRRMHFLRSVADEAAMWAARLEALRTGKLEVRRFLALKPYQPRVMR